MQLNLELKIECRVEIIDSSLIVETITNIMNERPSNLKDRENRTEHIRQQCRKTTVLSCHRCLINTGIVKMNNN
jgi:hypothetical protein